MHGSILPVTTPANTTPGILQFSPYLVVYWLQIESNHTFLRPFLPQKGKDEVTSSSSCVEKL